MSIIDINILDRECGSRQSCNILSGPISLRDSVMSAKCLGTIFICSRVAQNRSVGVLSEDVNLSPTLGSFPSNTFLEDQRPCHGIASNLTLWDSQSFCLYIVEDTNGEEAEPARNLVIRLVLPGDSPGFDWLCDPCFLKFC